MTITLPYLVQRLDGPDCSHYQPDAGPVDLSVTRATPTTFIAWKATQSTLYIDPTYAEYRALAKLLGFSWTLSYHWLSSISDPIQQADHYLQTIQAFGPSEGVMLDAEEAGTTVEKCLAWLERVESVTHRPSAVYTGIYVSGGTIYADPRIRSSVYGPRMVHLAAYVSPANLYARLSAKGLLELPIDAWQWSSNGPVPGITGRCDMNSVLNPAGLSTIVLPPAPPTPPTPPVPWPPFNPKACQYGLYPIAKKPRIQQGDRGNVVKYLQGVILCKAGGNITVDGIFGSQTERRVKDVQRLFKLTIDGIVGPQTWPAIDFLSQT